MVASVNSTGALRPCPGFAGTTAVSRGWLSQSSINSSPTWFIGTAIALYTAYYLEDDPHQGYFYALLFLFMASMLGLVWADNLLALFLFWEGTSITSYLLIAYHHEDEKALQGARTAFVVTNVGALAMLWVPPSNSSVSAKRVMCRADTGEAQACKRAWRHPRAMAAWRLRSGEDYP